MPKKISVYLKYLKKPID